MFRKKSLKKFLTVLLSALLISNVPAATLTDSETAALRERFEKRQRETRTLESSFTQTLWIPGLRDPVTSTGTLSYRAPECLKMEFNKPEGEFALVVDNRLFLRKSGRKPVEKSLTSDPAGKPFLSLLGLLRGAPVENTSDFTPWIAREGSLYTLILTRKSGISGANAIPKKITNTLDVETLEVLEVMVELPNGAMLRFQFDGTLRNHPLNDARFEIPDLM